MDWNEIEYLTYEEVEVAPYTGAWIEIQYLYDTTLSLKSHPTRVRGLKFYSVYFFLNNFPSHPTRVRGLKFSFLHGYPLSSVAPYTGAWIEILTTNL